MKFNDDDIKARRTAFLNELSTTPDEIVNHWPLFAGEVPISRLLAVYECFKMTINIPGHIAEFGVWKGSNLLFFAKLLKAFCPNNLKQVIGFDSWKGLSEFSEQDGAASQNRGRYAGNPDFIRKAANVYELGGYISLVDGLIEKSLPVYLRENPHHIYSLLYLDTDLYPSTKVILEQCWPRLAPGGIAVFDEGYDDGYPGEGAALNEFFADKRCEYGAFPFARQPMLWVRKNV
jgi:hypothetical protein